MRKSVLIRLWTLRRGRRRVAVEALVWLAVARLMILALPFQHIGRLASLGGAKQGISPELRAETIRRIRWAIAACARRVPWRALCFEQGLAAQFMLRRRGIPSQLFWGAAPNTEKGLAGHVWVRDGDTDVVGCENASKFAVLATFPAQHTPSRIEVSQWTPNKSD